MQKTFSIGLTAAMALTLAACGNSNNNNDKGVTTQLRKAPKALRKLPKTAAKK